MIGRTNVSGGGGGGGLNFSIVGGTTRPVNPTQNMVWVNTAHEITDYVLSAVEPENPSEGMLWLTIGNSGSAKVSAPIGNGWITLYLYTANQYIDGQWVKRESFVYYEGTWNAMLENLYLIRNGLAKVAFTVSGMSYTENASGMTVLANDGYNEMFAKNIDLTGRSQIVLDGKMQIMSQYNGYYKLAVWKATETAVSYDSAIASVDMSGTGATLDVSALSGEYIVGFCTAGAVSNTIYNLYAI